MNESKPLTKEQAMTIDNECRVAIQQAYKLPIKSRKPVSQATWNKLDRMGFFHYVPGFGYRMTLAGSDYAKRNFGSK